MPRPKNWNLTPREYEVAVLLQQGKTPALIAHDLGISTLTVRNVMSRVYGKLMVHNLAELKAKALEVQG